MTNGADDHVIKPIRCSELLASTPRAPGPLVLREPDDSPGCRPYYMPKSPATRCT